MCITADRAWVWMVVGSQHYRRIFRHSTTLRRLFRGGEAANGEVCDRFVDSFLVLCACGCLGFISNGQCVLLFFICVRVRVCMCVCLYLCTCLFVSMYMYVGLFVCTRHVCLYVCLISCIYVNVMCVCVIYVCMCACTQAKSSEKSWPSLTGHLE